MKNKEKILLSFIDAEDIKKIVQETIRSELVLYLGSKPPPNELISRKETASILGISLPTLSAWTKQGIVTAYRAGCSIRYKRHEVESSLTKIKTSI